MKILLAISIGWVLLLPATASAINPGECARLMRQIYHFRTLENRADQLGNEIYAERMLMQTDMLRGRFDDRCEGFSEDDRLVRQAIADFARTLRIGAEAAAKYFSMGAM
jgi:hypothetical protein